LTETAQPEPEYIMTLDEFIELLQKHQKNGFGSAPVKMVRSVEQDGKTYHVYGNVVFLSVGSNTEGQHAVVITDDFDIAKIMVGDKDPLPEPEGKPTEDLTHLLAHVKNQQLS